MAADLDQLSINTIRFLAADGVQKANSGHAGLPMGAAPMAYVLWSRHLKHDPSDPLWFDRDRFVLSAGHGSMLLYSLLHLTGYPMGIEDLKQFRQWESKTPGHPESFLTEGVETTTGPLGQGIGNAVGMAMAERHLAAAYNRPGHTLVDHYTYVIVSDGDLMEGISHEAASLAGHLGLGKLVFLYDDNKITIDGSTDLAFTENVGARFEAYGWHVQHVTDGNDVDAIDAAIRVAKTETARPSLIAVRTIIGFGAPTKQGTSKAHSEPLGLEEIAGAKKALGWPYEAPFTVPDEVYAHLRETAVARGAHWHAEWSERVDAFRAADAAAADAFQHAVEKKLPDGWDADLPVFEVGSEPLATRAASGKALGALAGRIPFLVGGSADLTPSNKTDVKGRADFQKATPEGGYFRFGVREHAMASACNGMALHGGLRPYCGTFLIFSDYLRPALRLSALMEAPVVYVFTHDSIGVGEDGPTHQPIAQLAALRAIPNVCVLRPADANETVAAWRIALENAEKPTVLALTRQNLPILDPANGTVADGVRRGAYVLRRETGALQIILIGSGSEVHLALGAAERLAADGVGVRVVSMPSWDVFAAQDQAYRDEVLPPSVRARVSVEAAATFGWERWVGLDGRMIGIDHFGASAPAETLFEQFGFTVDNVVAKARELLG